MSIQKSFYKLDKVEDKIIIMQELFNLKQNSLYDMNFKINDIHGKVSFLESIITIKEREIREKVSDIMIDEIKMIGKGN